MTSDIEGRLELYFFEEGDWQHYPLFRCFESLPPAIQSVVDTDQEWEVSGRSAEPYFMFGG